MTEPIPRQRSDGADAEEAPSEPIGTGAEGTVNVTLRPGRYELYCPAGNGAHKQAGMKATITVTAEESAPSSTH
jgi:uncharacterized cupredoxin-like copper-binding protein